MKILRCGRTDRQTDGAGYIGPSEGQGRSKRKLVNESQDNEFGDKSNLDTGQKWNQFGPENLLTTETTSTSQKSVVYHDMQNKTASQ